MAADGREGERVGVLLVEQPQEEEVEGGGEGGRAEGGGARVERAEVMLDRTERAQPLGVAAREDEGAIARAVRRRGVREEEGADGGGEEDVEGAEVVLAEVGGTGRGGRRATQHRGVRG
eukprot:2800927-Prymnesium_polylepis.2